MIIKAFMALLKQMMLECLRLFSDKVTTLVDYRNKNNKKKDDNSNNNNSSNAHFHLLSFYYMNQQS